MWELTNLSGQYTRVGGNFRLSDFFSGALPGWYGTGVARRPATTGTSSSAPATST